MTRRTAATLVLLSCCVLFEVRPACAQAWVPPHGDAAVSFMTQDLFGKYHQFPGIGKVDNGPTTSRSTLVDVTYGVTDRLAVSFAVPWVAAKYVGPAPHPLVDFSSGTAVFYGATRLDDGTFHGTFQDLRFDVRYNVKRRGLVLTPFAGMSAPSHDYSYFAHAAPGQHLKQLQFGLSAARMFEAGLPGVFVQARYAYTVSERAIEAISHNRSNLDLEIGYFLTPRLRLMTLGAGQLSHGGIDMVRNARTALPPLEFINHDRVTRVNYLNLGGGAAYSLSERLDLFGSLIRTVAARNGHITDRGMTLGLTWNFSLARGGDRAIARAEQSLSRCACTKSASGT